MLGIQPSTRAPTDECPPNGVACARTATELFLAEYELATRFKQHLQIFLSCTVLAWHQLIPSVPELSLQLPRIFVEDVLRYAN